MFKNGLQVLVHTERLRSNVRWLQQRHPWLMPVIKADAYGHDNLAVARVLSDEGVTVFAVGTVEEAYELRLAGINGRLVALMGFTEQDSLAELSAMSIVPLIHSPETLACAANSSEPVVVALKLDTGMGRLGFSPQQLPELIDFLRTKTHVRVDYFLSHLASADDSAQDGYTRRQALTFFTVAEQLRMLWPDAQTALVNSPGLLAWPELCAQDSALPKIPGDLVRPGLALYGINPLAGTEREALGHGLLPVMDVHAPVLGVHDLRAGQSVSYGATFTATRPMRVAVVGAGYADGFMRAQSCRGKVFVGDGFAPVLGRVCMQMTVVDITTLAAVRPGDRAWLLGAPEGASCSGVTVQDMACAAGTIPYEALCYLGRNSRKIVL